MSTAQSALFVLDSRTRTFRLVASRGFGATVAERVAAKFVFRMGEERGVVGLVGARMQPFYIPNVLSERRWVNFDARIRSAYFIPVVQAGILHGVLGLYALRVDAFSAEHRDFADAYAAQIGQLLCAASRLGGAKLIDELTRALFSSEVFGASTPGGALRSHPSLSERELEVVASLRRGLRISQVATTLSISTHTARNHVKRIYRKLGVHSQVELLAVIDAEGVASAESFRLQETLDLIPDAVVLVDAQGLIHAVNASACAIFRAARTELVGGCVDELVATDRQAAHATSRSLYFAAPTQRSMGGSRAQLTAQRADGTTFRAEVALGPLAARGQKFVLAVVRDISDRPDASRRRTGGGMS